MIGVGLEAIGLRAPGLAGWTAASRCLAGAEPYAARPLALPPSGLLPANERRRAAPLVRLAMAVGEEAFAAAGRDAAATATLFASSTGDGETIHNILGALATSAREVSPTRFHNSVHNAPAGYWSIATGCHEPSTSLAGFNASFAVGLLEAAAQASVDRRAVALVAYDWPLPPPLADKHPMIAPFAVALVLLPEPGPRARVRLGIDFVRGDRPATRLEDAGLEALRAGNPAARALPLLAALARRETATIVLEHAPGSRLVVTLEPEVGGPC